MTRTEAVLAELVGMDTTSAVPNLALVSYVEDLLGAVGVSAVRIPSPDGRKANLLARIGPEREGGVVLSAHSDCVPVTGQPWSHDPFTLRREGERLYGRGTTDMKGFLAVILAALPGLAAAELRRPIFLALSYDEEVGTFGAPALAEWLVRTQPRPSAVIVGEPTNMAIATAHKGVRFVRTHVYGRDAHSSQPRRGSNAVIAASRIAMFIDELADGYRQRAADHRFDPPYTTFNVARVSGGQSINIIPRYCALEWEYRPVPCDDDDRIVEQVRAFTREEVIPRLRASTSEGHVRTEVIATVRALGECEDATAERLVRRLTAYDGPVQTVAFGTDGGHFASHGLPTVVCGPGSIDQAHQADEYITWTQLDACERMLGALADELSRDPDRAIN